jgi:hypothetical protein
MSWKTWINVSGLFLGFIGTILVIIPLLISKKQAIESGVTRIGSATDKDNEKLPLVRLLLNQSRFAKYGFIFIALGFLLQIISAFFI